MSEGICARLLFNRGAERFNFAGASSTACGQMRSRGEPALAGIRIRASATIGSWGMAMAGTWRVYGE